MEFSVVLFDEIEKASDSLWQLMLGILDKATLTLGDNTQVDFSKVIIVMTSNLGGADMQRIGRGFGFHTGDVIVDDEKNQDIALQAAKKHFTPEFMNRLDHVVTFKTLTKPQIEEVMVKELALLQQTMWDKASFLYELSFKAKTKLIEEGYSDIYGARQMKRTIEQRVRTPLSRLVSSKQITAGDCIIVDDLGGESFEFAMTKPRTDVSFKGYTREDILES